MLLFPQKKRTSLTSIWLDLKLIFQAVGLARFAKTLRRERLVDRKRPGDAMAYLWFIGVDPQNQNCGTGSELLRQILDHTAQMNLSVFLETSVARNLSWYERFGFRQYEELDLGYHLFFMTNDQ
ncbi:N-acetyltransferase [Pedobacter sp. V48]|uniref:GNAT family N-acetyltransferase n=1 Tax=Pedobacter sp. V48 TaxID=509635 RepID=UPI001F39AC8F|nr:GNAT family N-acetyltransferase [Pedobacter sp. V48]